MSKKEHATTTTADVTTWIRISDIAASEMSADMKIHLIAMAMEEYALAYALMMIHGPECGAQRYVQAGGHVRFDDDGEPIIWTGNEDER